MFRKLHALALVMRSLIEVFLFLNSRPIPYVIDSFKYLGITFLVKKSLNVDVYFIKRKSYGVCNSILMRRKVKVLAELYKCSCH